jgi:hypothetical protein
MNAQIRAVAVAVLLAVPLSLSAGKLDAREAGLSSAVWQPLTRRNSNA